MLDRSRVNVSKLNCSVHCDSLLSLLANDVDEITRDLSMLGTTSLDFQDGASERIYWIPIYPEFSNCMNRLILCHINFILRSSLRVDCNEIELNWTWYNMTEAGTSTNKKAAQLQRVNFSYCTISIHLAVDWQSQNNTLDSLRWGRSYTQWFRIE